MKHTNMWELWNKSDVDISPDYHHLSYVLFRTDHGECAILGARCPDMTRMAVGRSLPEALGLSREAMRYLLEDATDTGPMFVQTDMGVGILDKRYDRIAGVGLYLHLHGNPESLARLLNHGVWGEQTGGQYRISKRIEAVDGEVTAKDMPAYGALLDAQNVPLGCTETRFLPTESDGALYRDQLCEGLEKMAAFVGCGLRFTADEVPSRIQCYRTGLLEVLLLCLLTEVRMVSATREAVCQLTTLDGEAGGNLSASFRYTVEDALLEGELDRQLDAVHRHLDRVCELSGLELHVAPERSARANRHKGGLTEMCLTLDWLSNPALLSTTDLKAQLCFSYQKEDDL